MDLRRQLGIVALVYVIEGYPMGVYANVFGFYFARQDVPLASLGLLGGLSLAWSLKVFWSPLVERFGSRQQWIAGALVAMAACLAVLALVPAQPMGALVWAALAFYCLASATQDIAIDAYTIGVVDRDQLGPANAVRTVAYRVGMIGGNALLWLPRWIGWSGAFAVGALASLCMALSTRATPPLALPPAEERRPLRALARWSSRPGVWSVAGFVLLFRIGDKAMAPMLAPFWEGRGVSEEEFSIFFGVLGALLFAVGGVAGGWWVARSGIRTALWGTGVFALVSNLAYAAAAAWPESGDLGLYAAGAVESASSGAVGAAFVAYLMAICDKQYAAVEYALLTSLYAFAGSLLAGASGWITGGMGFAGYFALTALFAAPAFALLSRAGRWLDMTPNGVGRALEPEAS